MSLSLVPTLSLSHMERDNKSAHTDLLAPVSLPQIEATDLLPQREATDLLAVRLDKLEILFHMALCLSRALSGRSFVFFQNHFQKWCVRRQYLRLLHFSVESSR